MELKRQSSDMPKSPRRRKLLERPMTADDPMTKLVGSVTDAPRTDARKKHEYLADALAPRSRD